MLISLAFTPAAFSRNTTAEKPMMEITKGVQPGSLTAVIGDSVTFSTLTKALMAAQLDTTLGAKGEFTIFAPTDEAFGKLPAKMLTKLMLPENKEDLRSLPLYQVIAGRIEIDDSKVFSADEMADNGVMHSIGKVLIPKSHFRTAGVGAIVDLAAHFKVLNRRARRRARTKVFPHDGKVCPSCIRKVEL